MMNLKNYSALARHIIRHKDKLILRFVIHIIFGLLSADKVSEFLVATYAFFELDDVALLLRPF